MGMPIPHLLRYALYDIHEIKLPPLFRQAGQKYDLEEEITQFLADLFRGPSFDGI